jgi:VWFA-related protein
VKTLLAFAATATLLGSLQAQPLFRAGVDAVIVSVTVTHSGRGVSGLTSANFELKDNGVTQHIEDVRPNDRPIDLLLVLDVSGSVTGEKLESLKRAARAVSTALRTGDRLAILTFSNVVRLVVEWSTCRACTAQAIDSLTGGARTSLYDAVFAATMFADSSNSSAPQIILVTDGFDTTSWLSPLIVLGQAKRSRAVFHVIRVGHALPRSFDGSATAELKRQELFRRRPELARSEFLPELAEVAGTELIEAEDHDRVASLARKIAEQLTSSYLLAYTPSGVAAHGWHSLTVRLKGVRGSVEFRRGYQRQ